MIYIYILVHLNTQDKLEFKIFRTCQGLILTPSNALLTKANLSLSNKRKNGLFSRCSYYSEIIASNNCSFTFRVDIWNGQRTGMWNQLQKIQQYYE